jgi:hypothetical protein
VGPKLKWEGSGGGRSLRPAGVLFQLHSVSSSSRLDRSLPCLVETEATGKGCSVPVATIGGVLKQKVDGAVRDASTMGSKLKQNCDGRTSLVGS